jgi:RNA polymerase sporulation-specific sigma factor
MADKPTPEMNNDMVRRYQAGEQCALIKLWTLNSGLVNFCASRYWRSLTDNPLCDNDDFAQEAFISLCMAAKSYDEKSGLFSNWFMRYMQYRMNRVLLSLKPQKKFNIIVCSLDAPIGEEDDGTLNDIIPDIEIEEKLDGVIERIDLKPRLDKALKSLSGKERDIIEKRFGLTAFGEMSLSDIGAFYGEPPDKIRRQYNKALWKMENGPACKFLAYNDLQDEREKDPDISTETDSYLETEYTAERDRSISEWLDQRK